MIKNPRFKVASFETRPNQHPESSKLWPLSSTAVLECGHRLNLGVGTDYRPKRMACGECGQAQRAEQRYRDAISGIDEKARDRLIEGLRR